MVVNMHIGDIGCYNQAPNTVALRWGSDPFAWFKEFGCGYSLLEFNGPFGGGGHSRLGTLYEVVGSYQFDRALLQLMLNNRI